MYKLNCQQCNNPFKSSQPYAKRCSSECRKKFQNSLSGRYAHTNSELPTGTVGTITEILVCVDLFHRGYSVFRAVSPSCYCDLIAVKGDKVLQIEARTGYISATGKLAFASGFNGDSNAIVYAICERNSLKISYLNSDKSPLEL